MYLPQVAFFGDSITWLNSYLNHFREILAAGEGTSGLGVRLVNYGINGVKTIGLANGTHNVTGSDQCRLDCPPGQQGRIVQCVDSQLLLANSDVFVEHSLCSALFLYCCEWKHLRPARVT